MPVVDPRAVREKFGNDYLVNEYTYVMGIDTRPPADTLLRTVFTKTQDVALVLSPRVDAHEFKGLPDHECQRLFLGQSLELRCLYFGRLAKCCGSTMLHV